MRSLVNLTRALANSPTRFPRPVHQFGQVVPRRFFSLELSEEEKRVGSFDNFDIDPQTVVNLKARGIDYLFPIQVHAFQAIKAGKDFLGKDQTGSGKTLAFLLPVIERLRERGVLKKGVFPKVLVMAPTRELAMQIEVECDKLRKNPGEFRSVTCVGGMSRYQQATKLAGGVDVVVGTPGRIFDFLERGELKLQDIEVAILDEVDTMLDMGFRVDINTIIERMASHIETSGRDPQDTQFVMFSATIPPEIKQMVDGFMNQNRVFVDMTGSRTKQIPKTITHYIQEVKGPNQIIDFAVDAIRKLEAAGKSVLVFLNTKRQLSEVHQILCKHISCGVLFSDVDQRERSYWLGRFKQKVTRVLLSTNVASRGIDVPDIDVVMQINLDKNVDEFVHRTGRTGRAGKVGTTLSVVDDTDEPILGRIGKTLDVKFRVFKGSSFESTLLESWEEAKKTPPSTIARSLAFVPSFDRNDRFRNKNQSTNSQSYQDTPNRGSWKSDKFVPKNEPQTKQPDPAHAITLEFGEDFDNISEITMALAAQGIFPNKIKSKHDAEGSREGAHWKLMFVTRDKMLAAKNAISSKDLRCKPTKIEETSA
jgi:superfamily II DNA/RNA helicase